MPGMVAAKHRLAAEAGVDMLERGGNAVDAAVSASYVSGVVEPWMSGIGGSGYLVVRMAADRAALVVDGGARAPLSAHERMFDLLDVRSPGIFPWRAVADDANHQGWRAAAVPGTVACLALALARFGRLDASTVMAPAIRLAREGVPVGWYTTLRIALDAPTLSRYPGTAATFFAEGFPLRPATSADLPPTLLVQPELASTLERIASNGADELYRGGTAARIAAGMRANGGAITQQDLGSYEAEVRPALECVYRGWRVATTPGENGGPWLAQVFGELDADVGSEFASPDYLDRSIHAYQAAFKERFASERVLQHASSTTHVSVVDGDGNVVSCTQTLVSPFGSRVTVPGTGILLNNGMYWFDPEPGRANSVGPGKRPLANMAPLILEGPGGWPRYAIGSSGGRRIMCANAQLVQALVDGGLAPEDAVRHPRLDASGPNVLLDRRIPAGVHAELGERGHRALRVEETTFPQHFASPAVVGGFEDGRRVGAVDHLMPAAVASQRTGTADHRGPSEGGSTWRR